MEDNKKDEHNGDFVEIGGCNRFMQVPVSWLPNIIKIIKVIIVLMVIMIAFAYFK